MRGKPTHAQELRDGDRNIPAYAGKTLNCFEEAVMQREHPRVCGENAMVVISFSMVSGTSPRMRGKRFESGRGHDRTRNIPAYAGKTCRFRF